jgi:hypothetical protein
MELSQVFNRSVKLVEQNCDGPAGGVRCQWTTRSAAFVQIAPAPLVASHDLSRPERPGCDLPSPRIAGLGVIGQGDAQSQSLFLMLTMIDAVHSGCPPVTIYFIFPFLI